MTDEYFDVNGQSACQSCRDQIAQHAETPRGWAVLARASLFGMGAAILGAVLYYAVVAITNFEIGIVAIAIGYMVGYAVRRGTRGRGGRRFQVMAVILTYWAVGLAYTPIVFKAGREQNQQAAQTQANPPASEGVDAAGTSDVNLPLAITMLLGFSLALPVLVVIGSLPGGFISAAIIAFGMRQAWRMTAAPQVQIAGPYRIGAGSAVLS
jgi:hypothetical protein